MALLMGKAREAEKTDCINTPNLTGAYAEVNLDHILHNYREARKWAGESIPVTCVVKADAYGHGERHVVQTLVEDGATMVCVSTVIEALRIRVHFPELRILILGYTPKHLHQQVIDNNFIQAVGTLEEAESLDRLGGCQIHIKVNSGMNRLGFHWTAIEEVLKLQAYKDLKIEGIFTHFHSSDSGDKTSANRQYDRFKGLTDALEQKGMAVGTRHICNSAGTIDCKNKHLDMVREGIMLYGLYPSDEVNRQNVELKEAMTMKTYIAAIREVAPGDGISYGHIFTADQAMKIATINLGYSDGVFRHLSNKGEVLIQGRRCPIVGRICMNMFMVDVTDLESVEVEDEVVVFGRSGQGFISIDEVAKHAGTISYEVVCRAGYSLPRVYVKNGQVVYMENDLVVKE